MNVQIIRKNLKKKKNHIPCGFLISTILVFDNIENKRSLYRVKDCMKMFCSYADTVKI